MIPRNKLERLPMPLPELAGYLVDSEGQVWRAGRTRRGQDLPLTGMRFTDAVHGWEERSALGGNRVLRLMPGVWKWCHDPTPGAGPDRLQKQSDWFGFAMYHLDGLDAESRAMLQSASGPECRSWFVVRSPGAIRSPLLIEGRTAFVTLSRNPPGDALRPD
jgi:hypothetical protein